MKKWLGFLLIFQFSLVLSAQSRSYRRSAPTFTYDLGASTGTYGDLSYTELEVGLNWYLQDYLAWRNSLFTRFGTGLDSATGLDTSMRLIYNSPLDPGGIGIGVFAGPGLRISNEENSGVFGEAGVTLKAGGFSIGGGMKSIYHPNPGKDTSGVELSKNENVVFLILAGGGAF